MAHHLGQPVQRNRFRHPVAKSVAQIVWADIAQARLGRVLLDQVSERTFGERLAGLRGWEQVQRRVCQFREVGRQRGAGRSIERDFPINYTATL